MILVYLFEKYFFRFSFSLRLIAWNVSHGSLGLFPCFVELFLGLNNDIFLTGRFAFIIRHFR